MSRAPETFRSQAASNVKQGGLVLENTHLALAARLETVPEDGAPGREKPLGSSTFGGSGQAPMQWALALPPLSVSSRP